jgi:two-component system alkaline phosphatase synthesis response regulator PhoP
MSKSVPQKQILLVEDEENLRETLKLNLQLEGFSVTAVGDGHKAIDAVKAEHFDCIILDIMLPGLDGITVCETIRLRNPRVPIMFLSARSTGADRVLGLKKGGDDYLTKPFNLEELLLRVDKLIEKTKQIEQNVPELHVYRIGEAAIDFNSHEITDVQGRHHTLTKTEGLFLRLLIENAGEVMTREHILQRVWGYTVYPTTRTIDNFIMNFRKYFEPDQRNPKHFLSVRGVGYKFVA